MLLRKLRRNRMQGRNIVEEVLCLSAQRGYTVFYRNREGLDISSLHFRVETTNRAESEHSEDRKISGSESGSGSSSGSVSGPSPRGIGRSPRSGKGRARGRNSGRSSLSFVVNPDSPSTPFPFNNAFLDFMYEFIQNRKNVELIKKTNWEDGTAPYKHWMDTPDHLYVIANTFNFCVVLIARLGSTPVLPLYSDMDCTAGTQFNGFISEQDHFIQQYHQDVQVGGWAEPYHNRIVDWITRYREMYPAQSHAHVAIN
ncbi:hypothetical protein M9H77_27254 [Catharanthus roseus]|uniref:Uncharacterized protein n=1 Tax=Catharanthus roseus TaxID=4058 RepID=A0ACC0ACZ9_CATRO|nr:hypothetical protein M9H77_27254 [Catharanthus roseus]